MCFPHRSFRQPGYTLIELVIVLLIIGITVSLVIPRLSLSDNRAELAQHAKNIETMIRLLESESTIRGRILGLRVKDDTLQILQLKKGKWETRVVDTTLKHYALQPPFKIKLDLGESLFKAKREDSKQIPAMFLPDGQSTPFEITITNAQTEKSAMVHNPQDELATAE